LTKKTDLEDLLRRVEAMERAVLGTSKIKKAKVSASVSADNFDGATGGVRFSFAEVEKAMQDNGYHYSRQAVQMPLTRLSNVGGPWLR
jgi:hypothetical protein